MKTNKNQFMAGLFTFLCLYSSFGQTNFKKTKNFSFKKGQKYTSSNNNFYFLWQTDGNLVVKTSSDNYKWGIDQKTNGSERNSINSVEFKDGNLTAKNSTKVIWSTNLKANPLNSIQLNNSGALQILKADNKTIIWASDGNLLNEGPIPNISYAGALGKTIPVETDIIELQKNCNNCKKGLELLKSNMYSYPNKPNVSQNGKKPWNDVWKTFNSTYLKSCKALGAYINKNLNNKIALPIKSSFEKKLFNVVKWENYFDGPIGIVTHGSRIPSYCPGLHRSQYDCVEASRRMMKISIPGVERIITILSSLECNPTNGYAYCRSAGKAKIRIYGTEKVSISAMKNVDHIYTTMTNLFKPEYPVSKFNGYKIYITNGETVSELDKLTPINTMWPDKTGENSADWLRGGTNNNYLWITEQMICKTGVKTRGTKDNQSRTFDQVIHEFGHAIDFRFQLENEYTKIYNDANYSGTKVERWAWAIQNWFGSPNGSFEPGELTMLKKIFKERKSFSCNDYKSN